MAIPLWAYFAAVGLSAGISGLMKSRQAKQQQKATQEQQLLAQRPRETEMKRQHAYDDAVRKLMAQKYGYTYVPLPTIGRAPKVKTGLSWQDYLGTALGGGIGAGLGWLGGSQQGGLSPTGGLNLSGSQ